VTVFCVSEDMYFRMCVVIFVSESPVA
jgi:hypothetical protein